MTSLEERLQKFKKQQEKCQAISSMAARAGPSKVAAPPRPANAKPPAPAVKFSNDTERLQHINSIRKAPVGAQIKRVIDLLLEVYCLHFLLIVFQSFFNFISKLRAMMQVNST